MNDWTSGYVAELDYTHDFFGELAPSHLAFCATLKGQKHGLHGEDLTYCELGCGQGFSANLLGAANPHIQFHAMDFNPSHITGARELATEAGLKNMHFHERSFEDFQSEPSLPDAFDVIALHGVYSWVSRENQKYILEFLSKRLNPGGLVYISYNTQPGWAAALPLRRIMTDRAAQGSGPLHQRISEAIAWAQELNLTGAEYFAANPVVAKRLGKMDGMSQNYLAHEFFNKDWTPFHFADIAEDLSQAKLSFLASSDPMAHVDDVCLSQSQHEMLERESDPVRRQSLRDILLNAQFRTDIFVRGKLRHTERGAIGAWFNVPLALARRYNGGSIILASRSGEEPLRRDQYEPLLAALKDGPQTVRQLLDSGAFGNNTWAEITRMLTLLIGAHHVIPCLQVEGFVERAEQCRRFNMAVCKRAEDSETLRFLASPVTGSGIAFDRFEQLFLLARSEGLSTPTEWAELAWQILAPQGQRLHVDGRILETPEENLAVLRVRANAFAAQRLPLCESLGITLEPPSPEPHAQSQRQSQSAA
ncbi:MAG: methyltransferase domain-containing protein [Rhodobacteraceae bacterium]|nr:methyltransferase domain-containing protein [Paracoccaceae bacterium]